MYASITRPTWRSRPETYGRNTRSGMVSTTTNESAANATGNHHTGSGESASAANRYAATGT